ncbi:Uncharacterised protein [Legionella wadsworthii]|uniref:Uncharacterized protein n=1 Tax=Legionella wadsworthii TaxID=28088 RepID=A0A378LMR9_9GAMM|nr:hypothetical protein [Legionella wadsworthii]STY28305.1 Uncharacterised protein [Legionella wadsworthii]
MYHKYPGFFPAIKSVASVEFTNVAMTSSGVKTLYRGDPHIPHIIFLMASVVTGVFCQSFPEIVGMEQIRLHKLTNLSNDFHMVSMTEDPEVAKSVGRGCILEIDPVLFLHDCVDVHATFKRNALNFPSRMEREKEHIALVLPFCSIKNIQIGDKFFENPFYLNIPVNDLAALESFKSLYDQLILILRQKYTQLPDEQEEKKSLHAFFLAYLDFYNKYSSSNPFNFTLDELTLRYPEFMTEFLQMNKLTTNGELMRDLFIGSSHNLFIEHPYTKNIGDAYINRAKNSTTCEEDPWAKSVYD